MAVNNPPDAQPQMAPTPISDALTNGHEALQPNMNIRRMPVFYERIELDGDFVGWWAKVRTNPPYSVIEALSDPYRIYDGLASLITDNNFVDEEGNPLPTDENGLTTDGAKMLPVDLGLLVINKWNDVRRLPPQPAGK